jgi:hypothetical protein
MIQQPPTELPTTLEGDAEAAFDHFDRKAFKANVAHNHKMLSNTTTSAIESGNSARATNPSNRVLLEGRGVQQGECCACWCQQGERWSQMTRRAQQQTRAS